MTDPGRQVTFADIGVEVIDRAAFAGIDKVGKVISAAFELFDQINVLVIREAMCVRLLNDVAVGPLEDHADLVAFSTLKQFVDLFVR